MLMPRELKCHIAYSVLYLQKNRTRESKGARTDLCGSRGGGGGGGGGGGCVGGGGVGCVVL